MFAIGFYIQLPLQLIRTTVRRHTLPFVVIFLLFYKLITNDTICVVCCCKEVAIISRDQKPLLMWLFNIVAIDTSFGKRILIMKVKTKAIIKIISQYFDFNA